MPGRSSTSRRANDPARAWADLAAACAADETRGPASLERGVRAAAALGLRSVATALLARGTAHDPALRDAVVALPDDRAIIDRLVGTCRRNVAVLSARGIDLWEAFRRWAEALPGRAPIVSADGNVLFRDGRPGSAAGWGPIGDVAGAAAAFVRSHPVRAEAMPRAVLVEGLATPWLLVEFYRATPRNSDGYAARIYVGEVEASAALDGLAMTDLSRELSDERVEVFVGPDASQRFEQVLRSRIEYALIGHTAAPAGAPRVFQARADAVAGEQRVRVDDLRRRVEALYAGRDASWWRRRYAEAAGGGRPLRVLLPTCRFSTFVRYSASDLARAFRGRGCEARVLIEPTDHDRLTALAYLRALAEFEPDLIVSINYPRALLAGAVPPQVPLVCWIQDAMPHLFCPETGGSQGELDFVAGHLFPELFERFGYPPQRALSIPVVADAVKFHPGPIAAAEPGGARCEIAAATHHSETPEALHRRLCAEASPGPTAGLFQALFPLIQRAVDRCAAEPLYRSLALETSRVVREHFGVDRPDVASIVLRQYTMRVADRVIRHQTLHWAADIAARRGWTLRIFGRGWESHPTLADWAGGVLEHGEALRASYRSAVVHLHVSAHWMLHQRVVECALSGGLPLCRIKADDFNGMRARAVRCALDAGTTPAANHADAPHLALCDAPSLMRYASMAQRLGVPVPAAIPASAGQGLRSVEPGRVRPEWLLVDPAEVCFTSPEQLERAVERFIEDPGRREGLSRAIGERARACLTTDALADRLVGLVRGSLGTDAGAARRAA